MWPGYLSSVVLLERVGVAPSRTWQRVPPHRRSRLFARRRQVLSDAPRRAHPLPALRHGVRSLAGGHGLPLAPLFPCRSPQSRVTPGHGSQHWQTAEHLGARRRHLAGAEGPAEYTLSPSDRPIRLACYSRMPELVTMPALITWEPRAEGVSVCLILTAWPEGLS